MSRLLLATLLVATPALLRGQDREALLEHRIKTLSAEAVRLQEAYRERAEREEEAADLVVIGKGPIFLRVPRWVAGQVAAPVEAVVDSWAVRVGPIFTAGAPDTAVVLFRRDTTGFSPNARRELWTSFPQVVVFNARIAARTRVQHLLGSGFSTWIGPELPEGRRERDRREAITDLALDTASTGGRCLEAELAACSALLSRAERPPYAARRSLLGDVLARAGPEGWSRLAADPLRRPEDRIAAAGGASFDELVARWNLALLTPRVPAPVTPEPGQFVALLWILVFGAILLGRFAWLRA